MARSKLTDKQWKQVLEMHINGVSNTDLAISFGVAESTIRKYLRTQGEKIKTIAGQIVKAERDLASLSITDQDVTLDIAAVLRAVSRDLAQAAKYGATSAHRMTMLANLQTDAIDPTDPLGADSVKAQIAFDRLTKSANLAADIPLSLLTATVKSTVMNEPPAAGAAQISKGIDAAQAASEYQKIMG